MEFLTIKQQAAVEALAHSSLKDSFYWTGGTLLAYHYLHHRRSLDLDFFSENPFRFDEVNNWVEDLKRKEGFHRVHYQKIYDRWEFLLENGGKLRIEFAHYNHEKKTLRHRQNLLGVSIDSLEDIAANKVIAYFDRNEPKDLFDLYFILQQQGYSPKGLLKLAEQKFGITFSESMFWSEAHKGLSLLASLKPLLFGSETEQAQLTRQVSEYFKKGSADFLTEKLSK